MWRFWNIVKVQRIKGPYAIIPHMAERHFLSRRPLLATGKWQLQRVEPVGGIYNGENNLIWGKDCAT